MKTERIIIDTQGIIDSKKISDAKKNLPGEQMGQYSENEFDDICQMTRTLNGPSENGQKSRG